MGTVPSQSSMHMRMFIIRSASMKVSRLVISRDPSSVSWGVGVARVRFCKRRVGQRV